MKNICVYSEMCAWESFVTIINNTSVRIERLKEKEPRTRVAKTPPRDVSDAQKIPLFFFFIYIYTHTFLSDLMIVSAQALSCAFCCAHTITFEFIQSNLIILFRLTSTATAHKSNHATHSSPQPLPPPRQTQSNTHTPPSPSSSPSLHT